MKIRSASLVVVVDFLVGILLMQQAILALSTIKAQKPSIPTAGIYAIEITWPIQGYDDVDLFVQDPQGNVCFYASLNAGFMHLEHDDLGTAGTGYISGQNQETTVIREIVPGEYTVNVHMFIRRDSDAPVTVVLYDLKNFRTISTTNVILHQTGDEKTAFRFTLNKAGRVIGTNHLQKTLVKNAERNTDWHA